jgi:hypothetical protein
MDSLNSNYNKPYAALERWKTSAQDHLTKTRGLLNQLEQECPNHLKLLLLALRENEVSTVYSLYIWSIVTANYPVEPVLGEVDE